jgi:phage shock protein C
MKKLYKSDTNKVISGVIGGIGEYYNIDPTVLRLACIVVAILTAIVPSILGYIVASIIVPSRPHTETVHEASV